MTTPSLWAIPLGGLGEFGMNMLALRSGDDIIVIDAGLMFPEQELLGVDIVIPDITYLKQNKRMVRAIVLTHAHEDHIGAIPYILGDLNVPIYGTQFTLALVRKKLEEHALLDSAKLHEVEPGETTTLGPFQIEYLHVTHSTIDCVALAVRTPVGVIIHTGISKSIRLRWMENRLICMPSRDTGRRACSRSSATAPTSNVPDLRLPRRLWWCGWKSCFAPRPNA